MSPKVADEGDGGGGREGGRERRLLFDDLDAPAFATTHVTLDEAPPSPPRSERRAVERLRDNQQPRIAVEQDQHVPDREGSLVARYLVLRRPYTRRQHLRFRLKIFGPQNKQIKKR